MEIESFDETTNIGKMVILGEGHTFLNLLRYYLANSDAIEYAGYTLKHPLETRSNVFLKTNSGSAKAVLLDIIQEIDTQIKEYEEIFKTKLKKFKA